MITSLALFALAAAFHQPAADGVPAERIAKLAKGVNISHWYWLPAGGSKSFASPEWFTKADAEALHAAGMTHVRLPLDPGQLFTNQQGGKLNSATMKKVDATLDMLKDAGLAVVVDLHALGTPSADIYEKKLLDPKQKPAQAREAAFVKDWEALADHLSTRNPDWVFLELLNEPVFDNDPKRWEAIQSKLATAVRAKAPKHTIVVTGNDWGSIAGLKKLTPLTDHNVIYSFHFYEPHTFTHQSATWGATNWKFLKDIPYPGSPEIIKPVLDGIKDDSARAEAKWYGSQNWNAAKIEDRVKAVADWGKAANVVVWCGEFGVIREAPQASRVAWLSDLRGSCEKHQIGWCMWDWAGGFGVVNGEPGKREMDSATAAALGLKAVNPPQKPSDQETNPKK